MLTQIGKTLVELTTRGQKSLALADRIAFKISMMSELEIHRINQRLIFNFPRFSRRPSDPDRIVETRRIALLLESTLQGAQRPVSSTGIALNPASWNFNELDSFIRYYTVGAGEAQTQQRCAYLAPSFWVYASEQERMDAIAGIKEGKELCAAGLMAAMNTTSSSAAMERARESGLGMIQWWFGQVSEAQIIHVQNVLKRTLTGFNCETICLHYQGSHVNSEVSLFESGINGHVRPLNVWGQATERLAGHIFLGTSYFDPTKTSGPRTQPIVGMDDDMQVSRGGAILHEATHSFGDTRDVHIPDEVYRRHDLSPPAQGQPRAEGYGGSTCIALARSDPSLAIKNADNYRAFCEEAVYAKRMYTRM